MGRFLHRVLARPSQASARIASRRASRDLFLNSSCSIAVDYKAPAGPYKYDSTVAEDVLVALTERGVSPDDDDWQLSPKFSKSLTATWRPEFKKVDGSSSLVSVFFLHLSARGITFITQFSK